jgi:hypothetical protein
MFIEVVGDRALPEVLDRDDVEDLLADRLGDNGEVTGAGVGMGRWHLDIEVNATVESLTDVVSRLAQALVDEGLGWVSLRVEGQQAGQPAAELAG